SRFEPGAFLTPDLATGTSTHVRHKVLAMTMALGAITYLDRVTISVTRPYIARDLGLSPTQMGYVFSAFYMAYALFEIPTGWWGDKVGTRRVLMRIVCWWSAFTVLTGAAFSYSSLLAIRFLFGAGASSRRCGRAGNDPERPGRRCRPRARGHRVETAAGEPHGRLFVLDVLHAVVWRRLLRDMAADLSRVSRSHRNGRRRSRGI